MIDIKKSIKNSSTFDEYFENNELQEISIEINRKHLNFGILKIIENDFDEESFFKYLKEVSVTYALPSERINKLKDEGKFIQIYDETQEKFIRSQKSKNGEGGELILYSLLENHLNAPKLLSKMKLKTNGNMPVHGADGIHILPLGGGDFELIFCESKMYEDLKLGIDKAFESVELFIDDNKKLDFENTLISTNLMGEFDSDVVSELCEKILPSKEEYKTNKAISIFVGFEFKTDNYDKSKGYKEFSDLIKQDVYSWIEQNKNRIEVFFNKHKQLSFYFYLIPFENITNTRKRIIEEIERRKFDE